MSKNGKNNTTNVTRRGMLRAGSAGLASFTILGTSLVTGCKRKPKEVGVQTSSGDGPEKTKLRLGMIALTDCSPLVIAEKKGFFKKYGIEGIVDKKANWAAIRASLVSD